MNILSIAVGAFALLELSNVLALYFSPTLKQANAVGCFNAWEKSKEHPELHNLIKYLVYWVAGSKLIFILLLIVILIFADDITKMVSIGVLILSISTFYWKLYPLIRAMDKNNEISPKGYSKTLAIMIFVFMVVLSGALAFAYNASMS